jgi:phospholipid/cholesterol/gamma-HCH transport system substrate-binding protein
LRGSGTVLAATVDALNRVNHLLSDRNIATIGVTLDNVKAFSDEASHQKVLLADADATMKSVDAAAQSLRALSESGKGLLDGDGRRALHGAAGAAAQIEAAATETRALAAGLRGPTEDFAAQGLPRLTAAIVTLGEAAQSLKRLSDEAQQSPQALVGKAPPKELELKP